MYLKLYTRKLVDYGLPRQLIELVLEFITGLYVSLSWGEAMTELLDRGDYGVPQGSLEGMWNFSVYSDNIQREIIKSVLGINVGGQIVRDVVYADDDTPVNPCPSSTNRALKTIATEGANNCFKFKPSKCKVIGADPDDLTVYKIGNDCIQRADSGLLLGAVISGSGINAFEHVRNREGMVRKAITQIKSWRSLGLSANITFSKLFLAKILPRFTFAFSLLTFSEWGPTHDLIRKVFAKALSNACGWVLSNGVKTHPGVWFMIFGFPPVASFLRQEKLLMAARLRVGDFKAARIFRGLFRKGGGSFERDVDEALNEWVLGSSWDGLDKMNVMNFKKKVKRIAKKQWPHDLAKNCQLAWL